MTAPLAGTNLAIGGKTHGRLPWHEGPKATNNLFIHRTATDMYTYKQSDRLEFVDRSLLRGTAMDGSTWN